MQWAIREALVAGEGEGQEKRDLLDSQFWRIHKDVAFQRNQKYPTRIDDR